MDWREEKRQVLDRARCIIFKVGSAVVTDRIGLNHEIIRSLAAQMAAVTALPDGGRRRIILVTSAAVAAGRSVLRERGIRADTTGLSARQAAAAIGQGRVVLAWESAFREQNVTIAQILLTGDDFRSRERLLNASNTFAELLAWNVVPVINENDTVSTAELKFGDNDTLASLLVNLAGADLFVNLTSAPGVLAADPATCPDAGVLPCIEDVFSLNLGQMCGGKTSVGSGGMYSKLRAARRAAQRGVPTYILPGREPGVIVRAFAHEGDPGTWVRAGASHTIPSRKFWLAYRTKPVGSLEVDAGAVEALLHKGSSLLPGGITAVQGNFQKGALVSVTHDGRTLGVGLTNYNSATLARIRGLKRIEVAAILGDAHYPEVIHRDNLLLEAAV